jgi:N-acetylmuramoyl-L-alanine amidase
MSNLEQKPYPILYPHIASTVSLDKTAKGEFIPSPKGVVVHYTAGPSVEGAVSELLAKDLGYHLIIDRDGRVYQMTSLTKSVWHAGRAFWKGYSPNHFFLGVALVSWGELKFKKGEYRSYAGTVIPPQDVVTGKTVGLYAGSAIPPQDVVAGKTVGGVLAYWHKATLAQRLSLAQILSFFLEQGGNRDLICGHDECCLPKGRKIDPGWILQQSMDEIRKTANVGFPRLIS